MNLSENGARFIAEFEGIYHEPYNDPAGHATIGIGHLIHYGPVTQADRDQWGTLTDEECWQLLYSDVNEKYGPAVEQQITVPLNQNQFDALVSFALNLGIEDEGLRGSTLRRKLNEGNYDIRSEFMRWNKAMVNGRLVELAGLTRRRAAEADLFETSTDGMTASSVPSRERTYGWREIHSYARWKLGAKAADPTPGQSYGGKHAPGSWHFRDSLAGKGCAVDYGDANSDPQAVFDLFRPLTGGPIVELIWQHTIIRNGVESYYAPNDHGDHCHVAIAPDAQLPFDSQGDDDLTGAQEQMLIRTHDRATEALTQASQANAKAQDIGIAVEDIMKTLVEIKAKVGA